MLIQKLLGTVSSLKTGSFSFTSATIKYNKFAVILPDTVSAGSNYIKNIPIPLPLVGFEVSYASDIPFISNEYSEYPYLNKQLLVEGAIKQNADFSLNLHHLITELNPWTAQQILNQVFVDGIQEYVERGGTFSILTPWGDVTHAVLTGLWGVVNEAEQNGITYRMDLKKITKVYKNTGDLLLSKLSSYITGVIV